MDVNTVVSALDAEIGRLQQARELLLSTSTLKPASIHTRRKRTISPEGKARIAAAQRKRWAKHKISQ